MNPDLESEYLIPLRRFFQQHVPAAAALDINHDTALLGTGLLDSMAVIQLMVFLGEELGIQIEDEDFTPENLSSVGHLLEFIGRKRASAT